MQRPYAYCVMDHNDTTTKIYRCVNPDYNKSVQRSAGIQGAYRTQELRKITAYKVMENTNRPTNEDEWRTALESRRQGLIPDRSRQASRAPAQSKRRRSNTRSPVPTPGPSRPRSPGPPQRQRKGQSFYQRARQQATICCPLHP